MADPILELAQQLMANRQRKRSQFGGGTDPVSGMLNLMQFFEGRKDKERARAERQADREEAKRYKEQQMQWRKEDRDWTDQERQIKKQDREVMLEDRKFNKQLVALNRFENSLNSTIATTNPSEINSINKGRVRVKQIFDKFSEKYPELTDDMQIQFDLANTDFDKGIKVINDYNKDKTNLANLEKNQRELINYYSELGSKDLTEDNIVEEKTKLMNFYKNLSSLGKNTSNYKDLGFPDLQNHRDRIVNIERAHSGIIRNLDILNINEPILNKMDKQAILYSLETGDDSHINEILATERMMKTQQEQSHYNKIIAGIEAYKESDNILNNPTIFWDDQGIYSDEDGNVVSKGSELLKKETAKEETKALIDNYSKYNLLLRDFKTSYPTIDIPWEKKSNDDNNNLFENNMLMKEFNLNKEKITAMRNQYTNEGSQGEFSDWVRNKLGKKSKATRKRGIGLTRGGAMHFSGRGKDY